MENLEEGGQYFAKGAIYAATLGGEVKAVYFNGQIIENPSNRGENLRYPRTNPVNFLIGAPCFLRCEYENGLLRAIEDDLSLGESVDRAEAVYPATLEGARKIEDELLAHAIVFSTGLTAGDMCEYLELERSGARLDEAGLLENRKVLAAMIRDFTGELAHNGLDRDIVETFDYVLEKYPDLAGEARKAGKNSFVVISKERGEIEVGMDGSVLRMAEGPGLKPLRFDVEGWKRAHPGEELEGRTIDISEIAFNAGMGRRVRGRPGM